MFGESFSKNDIFYILQNFTGKLQKYFIIFFAFVLMICPLSIDVKFLGVLIVDFSLGWTRPDRLEQKLIYFKSSNFNISLDSMENLNIHPETLYSILVLHPLTQSKTWAKCGWGKRRNNSYCQRSILSAIGLVFVLKGKIFSSLSPFSSPRTVRIGKENLLINRMPSFFYPSSFTEPNTKHFGQNLNFGQSLLVLMVGIMCQKC